MMEPRIEIPNDADHHSDKLRVQRLEEENEGLRRELQTQILAKDQAKEKVRRAIQQLVSDNKQLKSKVLQLNAELVHERRENLELRAQLQCLKENGLVRTKSSENDKDSDDPSRADDQLLDDDDNTPAKPNLSAGSIKRLAKQFGAEVGEVIEAAQKLPEAATINEPGLLMMRHAEGDKLEICGGIVEALVARLYHPDTPKCAPEYPQAFILTHTAFAKSAEVFNLMQARYLSSMDDSIDELEAPKMIGLRRRMTTVLLNWAQMQPENFISEGTEEFRKFLADTFAENEGQNAQRILQFIAHAQEQPPPQIQNAKKEIRSPKPTTTNRGKPVTLDEIIPKDLARQLSLVDYDLFQKIKPSEYHCLAWTKPGKEIKSPTLLQISARFNDITRWIQYTIVSCKPIKKAASTYDKWVNVAWEFHKLKNYNGISQVLAALSGAAVHRLHSSMEKHLKANTIRKWKTLDALMSPPSYKQYRDELKPPVEPPLVPYMGIWLTDLTQIEESHPKMLDGHPDYINFGKHMMIAKFMNQVMYLQRGEYLQPVSPTIREFIDSQLEVDYDEEQLFDLSLELKPRGG